MMKNRHETDRITALEEHQKIQTLNQRPVTTEPQKKHCRKNLHQTWKVPIAQITIDHLTRRLPLFHENK